MVETILGAETRIAEKETRQGFCKGRQLGECTGCLLMLLLFLSQDQALLWALPHNLFPDCFTVLPQGYFCELRDPEHSCKSMHRSSRRDPKPIPDEEALSRVFLSSSSWSQLAMGSSFCGHTRKKTGKMVCQKINAATKSGA